ncbi:hypothetical protein [Microlunatus soli]|uniref:Uncharacterized protein n=1 Tax=Microlunatus soli TaxID=630515 RepID=A0A1H1SUA0_9ACTN|nr:hypothetical protein [Microlunatus soli]SDS51521.1 hypothetical protein SAMN04489812_2141 [Microlunatus soli]
MRRSTKLLLVGAAAAVASPGMLWASAPTSNADLPDSSNEWVAHGDYKAFFSHTGPEGETLKVWNPPGDGDAAVAYVTYAAMGDPGPDLKIESDRFVLTEPYHSYNLREGDSGKYDVPEQHHVYIKICRGYASIPGDNCDGYDTGVS